MPEPLTKIDEFIQQLEDSQSNKDLAKVLQQLRRKYVNIKRTQHSQWTTR